MYMSKIIIKPSLKNIGNIYSEHQALWTVFSDSNERKRDFLYRQTGINEYITVSKRKPSNVPDNFEVQTKPYDPKIKNGDILDFSLRFNPVRKTRINGKQVRYDIVQDLRKKKLASEDELNLSRIEIALEAAPGWFDKREEDIGAFFIPDSFIIESYSRESFFQPKGKKKIIISMLDLKGSLKVKNSDLFREKLFKGIGCAKGFGCGLLLVKRTRYAA